MAGHIRFIKNMMTKVKTEGNIINVPVSFGDIYKASKVYRNDEGAYNVELPNGDTFLSLERSTIEVYHIKIEEDIPQVEADLQEIEEQDEPKRFGLHGFFRTNKRNKE